MTSIDFGALAHTDSNASFANAVAEINKRGTALQLDIQLYLHAVARRWKDTGDVRPAVERINMLIDKKALFKGVRRKALVNWVEIMLGFEYITEGDNAHTFHANKAKPGFNLLDLAKNENHWYNRTPEPDPSPVSLNVLLMALVKKADKRAAKHLVDDDIPADTLAALKALVVHPTGPAPASETPDPLELEPTA